MQFCIAVWGSWHHKWWEPIIQQYTAVSQKTRIHSSKNSDKHPSKIIADILLTKYFHLMYQVNALTVHDITVIISLQHVAPWQSSDVLPHVGVKW
jgi:hypothetical protein